MSVRDFWKKPSWSNAGWVAADAIGAALPFIPVGSLRRARQLMNLVGSSASIGRLENVTEVAAFSRLSREGVVLATGQDNVRQAVGMTSGGPVADLLTMTPGNKFIISEVKEVQNVATGTADVGHALEQLSNTAEHLTRNVSGAEISRLEIVVTQGTNLGPGYRASGDQLQRFNSSTGKYEVVRIKGKVVHVTQQLPPPVPSSVPQPTRP